MGIPITEIEDRLEISHSTLYYWLKKENLDFEKIKLIGRNIGYDFSQDFDELKHIRKDKPIEEYSAQEMLNDAINERDFYRKQYLEIHAKYVSLLEKLAKAGIEFHTGKTKTEQKTEKKIEKKPSKKA